MGGKERPILMTAESVKAILDGRKTMTRRVVKPQPGDKVWEYQFPSGSWGWMSNRSHQYGMNTAHIFPYGQIGDRLWVRESFFLGGINPNEWVWCKADTRESDLDKFIWKPSIFMPRWASRLTLEITEVRVERLQEISLEDIKKEGAYFDSEFAGANAIMNAFTPKLNFINLWDSINGKKYPWSSNPWVWVVRFDNIGVRVK